MEVPYRESSGRKRYYVDVDLRANPYGFGRTKWLTCIRGHSLDLDFSVDNYSNHNTALLLNIKERVDNTFEYRGGLGKVTEEVFHSTLKGQLKVKWYELKKAMLEGKEKPVHIRQDHWLNLSKLIADEKKV
jgi:hypothetical protein